MKIKLLLLSAFIYINAIAQDQTPKMPIDETSKLITYTKVVELKGASKDSLYNKALGWCNEFFNNPNEVIREKDQKKGEIVCKARFKVMNPPDKKGLITDGGVVQYTLTIQFKDGRYKYVFTEYNWKQTSYYAMEKWMDVNNQYYKPEFAHYLQEVDDKTQEIMKSFDAAMAEKAVVKKDDW